MRLRLLAKAMLIAAPLGATAFYLLTAPATLSAAALGPHTANLANGETMFNIGGCASCHATSGQANRLMLGGGHALHTPFGTFKVPNISTDKKVGMGDWTELQFANAMLKGTGRTGEHLYPAFPFASYQRMPLADVRDLYAFLKTVPADATPSQPHDLGPPFNVRLSLGGWKLLFLDGRPFVPDASKDAATNRGAYLVEGPGHCAECHSPRNILGGIVSGQRLAGGPSPDGKGWIPNITPHADGLANWSAKDMDDFLKSGFTPDGRSVDPEMAAVIANTSKLSDVDRAAMARYLTTMPARPGKRLAGKS